MFKRASLKYKAIHDSTVACLRYSIVKLRCKIGVARQLQSDERHLLLLAWLFPPVISGGVYRPLSLARYAVERGWRVTVLAGPEPDVVTAAGRYLIDQLPECVRVVRIDTPELTPSYRFFPHLDGGFLNVIGTLDRALALSDLVPSVVLASGPPFHNFVVAWYLSKYFRAPLVLDYRDEWTQCPFDFVRAGEFDIKWERRCLSDASRVIVTTQSFAEHALKTFPQLKPARVILIPNGFEPKDLADVEPQPAQCRIGVPVEITFVGHLGSHTPPDDFIVTLRQALERRPGLVDRVRLRFVGNSAPDIAERVRQAPISHLIDLTDQVPKPEALRIMRESDALLILNPTALNRYIPGKLFDYLAVGTPILVYGGGGEVARIVGELEAGRIVPEGDAAALADALDWIGTPSGPLDMSKRQSWLAEHHRRYQANRLIDHLEGLTL